jgi:hypothetical protein
MTTAYSGCGNSMADSTDLTVNRPDFGTNKTSIKYEHVDQGWPTFFSCGPKSQISIKKLKRVKNTVIFTLLKVTYVSIFLSGSLKSHDGPFFGPHLLIKKKSKDEIQSQSRINL